MRAPALACLVALGLGAVAAAAAACSSFDAEETPEVGDGATESSTTTDDAGDARLPTRGDGGTTTEGGNTDASRSCSGDASPDSSFMSRFDVTGGRLDTDWTQGAGGACSTLGPTPTFEPITGGRCLGFSCDGASQAYSVIVTNQALVVDEEIQLDFEVRLDSSSNHTFAQVLYLLDDNGVVANLAFAVDVVQKSVVVSSSRATPYVSVPWKTGVVFHDIGLRITTPKLANGSSTFLLTVDGTPANKFTAKLSAASAHLQIGPFLSTTPGSVTNECYRNISFSSCH